MNDEHITAKEYARRRGKTEGWARYILKRAKEKGLELPPKYYGIWSATEKEWDKLVKQLNIKSRRRKNALNREK